MTEVDVYNVMLAQEGAAGLPGETAAVPAPGNGGLPPPTRTPSPLGGSSFMLFALVALAVMIILSTIGPRRERKRREAMISAIKKHDRVQTVGGVIGAIVEVKPDFVVLKVDESANTRITFARSAIQQVLSSKDEDAKKSEATD